jgi:hypothetical protein
MNFKLSYLGKEQTTATACNSKGYWISKQIWIGSISNFQLTHAYPTNMVSSHDTYLLHRPHLLATKWWAVVRETSILRLILLCGKCWSCYFTGRFTGSLSNALFLCVIKRRLQLLTLHEVGNRRVNWYRQLLEWHIGHHKSHTHRSRIDPALCIHCSFMLCCSTALCKTCIIWPLSFLVFNNLVVPHEHSKHSQISVSRPVLCQCVTVSCCAF